jgi:hypothetical protein
MGRPPLEEAVGEATGGRSGIEHAPARRVDREPREGGIELLSSPAHERSRGPEEGNRLVGPYQPRRLLGVRSRHEYDTGCDRDLRLVPVGDQAAADELNIKPSA